MMASIPTWSQVAAFHARRFSRIANAVHSLASVKLTHVTMSRHPRSTSTILTTGSGSDRRHSRIRGTQRAATSGTKSIMNEMTTSKGSLNHGAWSKSHGVSFTGTTYKKKTVAKPIVPKTGQRNVLRHRSSTGIIPAGRSVILSVSRAKGVLLTRERPGVRRATIQPYQVGESGNYSSLE